MPTPSPIHEHMTHELNHQGILIVRVLTGQTSTAASARQSVAVLKQLAGDVRRPLLVDLSKAKDLDAEARQVYIDGAPTYATRVALVSKSTLTRVVGNFFMAVMAATSNPIPMRLFQEEQEAMQWLLQSER